MNTGHVGGTRGSGIVFSTANLQWISVVRGMRGVGELWEMCVFWFGAAWVERGCVDEIRFGLYQSCENRGSVGCVSVFGLRWFRGEWVEGFEQGLEGWCCV